MPTLGNVLLSLFIGCWCVAAAGWIYMARFHYSVTFRRVRDEPRKSEYRSKAWRGCAIFVAAWCAAMIVGLVASFLHAWD
jgi:hypothetical protein